MAASKHTMTAAMLPPMIAFMWDCDDLSGRVEGKVHIVIAEWRTTYENATGTLEAVEALEIAGGAS